MTTDEMLQRSFPRWRNRNIPWYPLKGRRDDLAKAFGSIGLNKGVEVGTNHGRFALTLCKCNPNLQLTCVDPWGNYEGYTRNSSERQEQIYQEAVRILSPYNVTIIRKMSMDAVDSFEDKSLDFVYIDGNHEFDYVMEDILYWSPKVRVGGVVACHDYHSFVGCDVITAVNAYTKAHHIDPWYLTREETPTAYWVKK